MTIVVNGQTVEAVPVRVVSSSEPWQEYLLADGTVLRIRLIVTEVYQLTGQVDATGRPGYAILSQTIIARGDPPA